MGAGSVTFANGLFPRHHPEFSVDQGTVGVVEQLARLNHCHKRLWNSDGRLAHLRSEARLGSTTPSSNQNQGCSSADKTRHRYPSPPGTPRTLDSIRKPTVQAAIKIAGRRKNTFIPVERQDIARAVQYRFASPARAEMLGHRNLKRRIDVIVEVIRDFPPYVFTFYVHGFNPLGTREDPPYRLSNPEASRSRSIRRARNSLVFTKPEDIPSALAVSSVLRF